MEAAYKTDEALSDPNAGRLVDRFGTLFYTSIGYSTKGFGATLEGKRTENFNFRVSPLETQLNGILNFLPPMSRQNTYRLTSRYNPATQEFGEMAAQLDVKYSPKRTLNFNLNGSYITDLEGELLYAEGHINARYRKPKKYSTVVGIQSQFYNQDRYEEKPGVPMVKTFTPYADFLYKFSRKASLRVEAQYMYTREDFGQWVFGLAEFSFAPNWIITVSDMINVVPAKEGEKIKHFPTVAAVYNYKANRFGLAYVKQVEGVVCTGGICRYEPAFSGVKLSVNSSF
jgi:hypothetical protein